jgi:hypothetical protein
MSLCVLASLRATHFRCSYVCNFTLTDQCCAREIVAHTCVNECCVRKIVAHTCVYECCAREIVAHTCANECCAREIVAYTCVNECCAREIVAHTCVNECCARKIVAYTCANECCVREIVPRPWFRVPHRAANLPNIQETPRARSSSKCIQLLPITPPYRPTRAHCRRRSSTLRTIWHGLG